MVVSSTNDRLMPTKNDQPLTNSMTKRQLIHAYQLLKYQYHSVSNNLRHQIEENKQLVEQLNYHRNKINSIKKRLEEKEKILNQMTDKTNLLNTALIKHTEDCQSLVSMLSQLKLISHSEEVEYNMSKILSTKEDPNISKTPEVESDEHKIEDHPAPNPFTFQDLKSYKSVTLLPIKNEKKNINFSPYLYERRKHLIKQLKNRKPKNDVDTRTESQTQTSEQSTVSDTSPEKNLDDINEPVNLTTEQTESTSTVVDKIKNLFKL
ncbi:hypothetical protein SAMN05421734_104164 [Pelagirhabdus alkalitolerans]|uniref:Uncharacterized protein n=2 Tax=Pelagirhabdus alkalitolerans TaxID=1612202 RepID=A0A1G6IX54_9BACI|nr:hypothetical protein SAMN05421734_104164 [Pelagirhabdus alkalitolerans]